ncbi:LAFA_0D16380g1_1 [Lachancea sp. 'fantastica']|nr:LAFA_0D16380g1_1 [Lachancea sp. 'fantastica']
MVKKVFDSQERKFKSLGKGVSQTLRQVLPTICSNFKNSAFITVSLFVSFRYIVLSRPCVVCKNVLKIFCGSTLTEKSPLEVL